MNKNEILKKRIDIILKNNNISSGDLIANYENKFRELLLNYNDDMLQKNLNLMYEKNIEKFIDYMHILQKLYKDTIATILVIEKRINSAYKYALNLNGNKNLNFSKLNQKIDKLKNKNYEQYKIIKKLLWKKTMDSDLFYIALELCRIVRNEIIHKDWIGLIKININENKLLNKGIIEKLNLNSFYINEKEEMDLIDCFCLIDHLLEASNLENNFNNIKVKLKEYIMI